MQEKGKKYSSVKEAVLEVMEVKSEKEKRRKQSKSGRRRRIEEEDEEKERGNITCSTVKKAGPKISRNK